MITPPSHPPQGETHHGSPAGQPTHGEHGHAPVDDLGFDLPEPARPSKTRALGIVALLGIAATSAFFAGFLPKREAKLALAAETHEASKGVARVQVVPAKVTGGSRTLSLPASVQPLEETVVHARADGYVRTWKADIGDKVAEGALLAEVDTPEIDQQLAQARAQLAQAEAQVAQSKANREFSAADLERYRVLTPQGITSQQELDQRQAKSQVDQASVGVAMAAAEAQRANIRRLSQLKSYSKVLAPFGGTINARMVERGALVSPQTPLFRISSTDTVRVFVQVPQDVAPAIKPDTPAQVSVREYPGRVFQGTIARSAGALDPASRTMNTEVRVPNPGGELLSGMYAQVSLGLPSARKLVEVPATAVLNDARGTRVAVVGEGNRIKLVTVKLERDTGSTIELSDGLSGGEKVVKLASAELAEGQVVEVQQ